MTNLEHAQLYASRGWPVFPIHSMIGGRCSCGKDCDSPAKHPRIQNGFHGASTDPELIRKWWQTWPHANIGIPTGSKTFIAVDIDPGKNGNESLAELIASYGELPPTLESKTGSGGRHILFAGSARNSVSKLAPGIDIRGDGGYIVVPPSNHFAGGTYEWLSPIETPIAPIPGWLLPQQGNLPPLKQFPPSDRSTEDRCRAYLEKIPDAISGQGGHGNTLRAACECFRFGLTESQAWNLLCWFNSHKCQPEWSERELRHKLSEGRKLVDREGKFGERLKNDFAESDTIYPFTQTEIADPLPPEKPKSFPRELLSPPGVVGEIVKWINETAIKPQPILALANALAFYGAVVGRKVRTPSDLRTNLYCLGVGESGCGKDHSRKCIKKICEAAQRTTSLLGGEEIASDSSVENAVHKNNSLLFQLDEIGHFISQANSKYAQSHQRNIIPMFMRLFSSANTVWLGKEKAGSDRKDVAQPNVCLYGTTVPARLYEGLSVADVADGFLGRMLVFQSSDSDPDSAESIVAHPPLPIIRNIQAWTDRKDFPEFEGNIDKALIHIPHTAAIDDESQTVFRRFRADCREHKKGSRESGMDVLWARAEEHAMKLALVIAAGCNGGLVPTTDSAKHKWAFEPLAITADIAAWAVSLTEYITTSFVLAVGSNIASSDHERHVQFILNIISKAGANGISSRDLARRARKIPRKQRDEILFDLRTEQGAIVELAAPKRFVELSKLSNVAGVISCATSVAA